MNFSTRLIELIDSSPHKQKEISTQTGISESALANYKKDRVPKSEELFRLAQFFGVSMEWLLSGNEPKTVGVASRALSRHMSNAAEEMGSTEEEKQEIFERFSDAKQPLLEEINELRAINKQLTSQLDNPMRQIPLLGWAHAGEALDYEQNHEAHMVPTECRDPKAFAVTLEGDSMEPKFHERDVLVVMPSEFAYSGCLAVCKFADGGVIFRSIERQHGEFTENEERNGDAIVRLVPLNVRWQVTEHKESDFEWIYPIWGRWTQIWK